MFKLLKRLKGYNFQLLIVMICVAGTAFADLYLPSYLADIIDVGIVNKDIAYILQVGAYMMGITVIGIICTVGRAYYSSKIAGGFSRDLRKQIFKNVETFSLNEFDEFGTASLITRTTNDINQVQMLILITFRMILLAPVKMVGGVYMSYTKSPELSFLVLLSIPLILIVVAFLGKKAIPLSKAMQKKTDKINLVLREKLTGVRVIRAFNTVTHEEERFDTASKDFTDTSINMMKIMAFMMPALNLITNFTTVLLVWYGGLQISYGNIMVGDILAITQYIMQIMFALMMMSMVFAMLPRASASAQRIIEVLDKKTSVNDDKVKNADKPKSKSISFNNVTFSYPEADIPALRDITFTANQGETTAIIGSTGCGKTTLINLMLRFYDINKGEISVGGVNTKDMQLKTLRDMIGYVPQKAVLFKGNIATNLKAADKNASKEQIENAIKIAQSENFINEKENGIKSEVARGGANFSGGQKQRLSIARALTRKADIFIFDDSFSALDYKTDSNLRRDLKEYTENSTVIIVAQRVSTIKDADKIIVLDNGAIAGMGTHYELLENCEIYKEIVTSQFTEEEAKK